MKQTLTEKILSAHAGQEVSAGELAIVTVDGAMGTDATAPLAIRAFQEMGGHTPWDPGKFWLVIDHAAPPPNERVANLHAMMRAFAAQTGCGLYDVGDGICHQIMVEDARVRPGQVFVGADSHTPTYGAVNAFAIGVGSTDLAGVLLTGKIWLKVPETIRIELLGQISPGVTAKDLILFLVGELGIAGATYQAIEYTGPAVHGLSLASRMTLANMSAEMGAKTGLVDPTGLRLPYEFTPFYPDEGARYSRMLRFDVSTIEPQVAIPHSPDNVVPVSQVAGQPVHQAFLGSCTNARLEDLHIAARILKGQRIAPQVRMIVAPASRKVFEAALKDGTLQDLSAAGVTWITSGCGPCVGTHLGVPGDGEVIISSTNRNFRGRMGNSQANIYLSSPAVVAASALQGVITDPADVLPEEGWDLQ